MGMYLNPNAALLTMQMNSPIYVDKSMIIAELNKLVNTENRFVCVSRPRRFGKTMAGTMIGAYYSKSSDSRELFDRLKISNDPSYERYLGKFNVIKIDLNANYNTCRNPEMVIEETEARVVKEFVAQFPTITFDPDMTLSDAMMAVYAATGEQFVILIDEYDILVREQVAKPLFDKYLRFLNGLFKSSTLSPAIALAYLTGILPIVREKIQSKLNMFTEFTMVNAGSLAAFVGFTAEESQELCLQHGMDYEECCRWYDGYDLGSVKEVLNPKSVVKAMTDGKYGNYWTVTSSFEALRDYIMLNLNGIRDDVVTMIGGGKVKVDVLWYVNTMTDFYDKDDVFTYLIHLGYLAYDQETQQCYIPNNEVRSQWAYSIRRSPDYKEIVRLIENSESLVQSLLECDEEALAAALDDVHTQVTSPLTYNNEASFQTALGVAFFYATTKFTIIKELPSGNGYADLALIPYVPNTPAVVIELKNKRSAGSAMQQIIDKHYDQALRHYRGDLLFVGISYDPDTKVHECKISPLVIE